MIPYTLLALVLAMPAGCAHRSLGAAGEAVAVGSGYADVNGTRLYYEVAGQGEPVVLIHGGYMDRRMWDEQFSALAREHRVIRSDLRGAGRSARNHTERYAPAADLNALLEHLGESSVHVVGLSRGGAIALDVAVAFPDRVRTLVVAEPALPGMRFVASSGTPAPRLPSMRDIAGLARAGQHDAALELFHLHPPFAKLRSEPALLRRVTDLMLDNRHLLEGGDDETFLANPTIADRLSDIRARTLVITGENERDSYPDAVARSLIAGIRDARLVSLPAAGHFLNIEASHLFTRLVRQHIGADTP